MKPRPKITITIAGPQGSGKTALATLLARCMEEGLLTVTRPLAAPEERVRSLDTLNLADPLIEIVEVST